MDNLARRILAVLFGLRGVLNLFKPWGAGSGMVFFGKLLPLSTPIGPMVGVFLMIYAYGLFMRQGWAVTMGIIYALFATINVILFPIVTGLIDITAWQYVIFAILGIALPWAAVILLRRDLRRA